MKIAVRAKRPGKTEMSPAAKLLSENYWPICFREIGRSVRTSYLHLIPIWSITWPWGKRMVLMVSTHYRTPSMCYLISPQNRTAIWRLLPERITWNTSERRSLCQNLKKSICRLLNTWTSGTKHRKICCSAWLRSASSSTVVLFWINAASPPTAVSRQSERNSVSSAISLSWWTIWSIACYPPSTIILLMSWIWLRVCLWQTMFQNIMSIVCIIY